MRINRTCAAAAVLGALALPLTGTVGWADTAAQERDRPGTSEQEQVSARERAAAEQRAGQDAEGRSSAEGTGAAESRRQVSQRPVGAPDTGGGPAGWTATPASLAGGAAAVVAAGGGAVLLLRRRPADER
ncbi:hypothetical protein [Saccharopolyspora gregorii]|uniref:LPXTG cell wall anchor domain-containing protein n=1 Tax=Saccharopolyspora gregorii TaxID=33914 RepID=A0ABP6RXE9_9PSEU|nr:hypothetical protein [Saccharopolyspora gregorii]